MDELASWSLQAQQWRRHWTLDPAVDYLNHGSFGATPRPVLERQAELRARLEREPVDFFVRHLPDLLDSARAALAALLRAEAEDLVFVPNATAGVNAVLRSLVFEPGDELLVTDHEYNACRNALEYAAARGGARVVVAGLPFPVDSADALAAAVLAHAGPRTRLALLDHITSPTALVLPLERLVPELEGRGVPVLVDGAHAPGMLELELPALGASYYTANCHKWLCAPKGAALLWVRRDRQPGLHPLAISHGYNSQHRTRSRFLEEFDWTGTADPTPALCVPAAIDFLAGLLPGGLPALMARNCALARWAQAELCRGLGISAPCPPELLGAMAAVPLSDGPPEPPASALYSDALQEALRAAGFEVPVIPWPAPPHRLLRISAQAYNEPGQYTRLAARLAAP